jgi:hypothetical protein
MIKLREDANWENGRLEGMVRDDRKDIPDDGLLSAASFSMGDPMGGPSVSLAITGRRFPKKTPVHKHKSDTFRMALGEPIVVGRRSYAHGEFRLQAVDTYYGPESWTDEVGTNQLLVMADRRGGRPYLTTPELQTLSDMGRSAEEDLGEGFRQHPPDATIAHEMRNNFGVSIHAGHWDAGFTDTSAWPEIGDGVRLGVIAMGPLVDGMLFLCWDRPAGAPEVSSFVTGTDLAIIVVGGESVTPTRTLHRFGFRLHQQGSEVESSRPGPDGVQELWLLADRRGAPSLGLVADTQIASVVQAVIPA